jgi:hypothetical protein
MSDRYDELRAAAGRATPGPWQRNGTRMKWRSASQPHELDSHTVGPDGNALALVPFDTKSGLGLADAAFIALANPETILTILGALSDEIERADLLQAAVLERTTERDALAERVRVLEGALRACRVWMPVAGQDPVIDAAMRSADAALTPSPLVEGGR